MENLSSPQLAYYHHWRQVKAGMQVVKDFVQSGKCRQVDQMVRRLLCCYGGCNLVLQTGWLKQQKFIFSQLWRPEVQSQSVSRVGSFWCLGGRICSRPLSLAYRWCSSSVFFTSSSPYRYLYIWISPFSKYTTHNGLGLTVTMSSELITFSMTLFLNKVTF